MTSADAVLAQALGPAVFARQAVLAKYLFEYYQGVVAAGSFQGLKLLPDVSWGVGDNAAKLVGLYEAELQPAIAALVRDPPPAVINVGCAEGYYAVGLARVLPGSRIYAFDLDANAQLICRRTAALNDVAERVEVMGGCTPELLLSLLARHPAALVLLDCEGYEKTLIDGAVLNALTRARLIIECHDFVEADITATLRARLARTHAVELIEEGARNPNHLPLLRQMCSLDRWLIVLENRPTMMGWLVAQPLA